MLRKILTVVALTLMAPAALAQEATYEWSGLYAGAVVGVASGNSAFCDGSTAPGFTNCDASFPQLSLSGTTGGVTVGYNWQFNDIIAGVEADFSFGSIDGSAGDTATFGCGGGGPLCVSSIDSYATLRGRVGIPQGNLLPYLTAGVAFSDLNASIGTPPPPGGAQGSGTGTSAVLGGGVEVGLNPRTTMKFEYLYITDPDVLRFDPTGVCGTPGCFTRRNGFGTVRIGVNYQFLKRQR